MGESLISGERRKKDEPFNPFARDASAQRNKRMSERSQTQRRNAPAARPTPRPQQNKQNAHDDLAKRREQALKRLGTQESQKSPTPAASSAVKETSTSTPTFTNSVEKQTPAPQKVSKEDRLAELRRKSQASRDNAKAQRTVPSDVKPETQLASAPATVEFVSAAPTSTTAEATVPAQTKTVTGSRNDVFKTIQTPVAKPSTDRRRRRRRDDKKGGGRQKQEKKLNRQKYLEYKYAAKDILDSDQVSEEHRSNVLGQIWAKGERIGIADSLLFIESKVEEEILPREVADKLRDLVSRMTTRR
jgi:hypothetical protein